MNIVIIGASHAGIALADNLRKDGYQDKITIIEKLNIIPVEKPPLSKKFLDDDFSEENIQLRKNNWFKLNSIELLLNKKVLEIDKDINSIKLETKETIHYDFLVIATGAKANFLPDNLVSVENQSTLRNIYDIKKIIKLLIGKKHITIVGGGYIGLELASSLKKGNYEVSVIEMSDRILERVASKQLSQFFTELHQDNGVNIFCNDKLQEVIAKDNKFYVKTKLNDFETDLILVGIGVSPEIQLAQKIGIDCEKGILVDENYKTSCENIFSIGDCALNKNEYGIIIESIHHAQFSASRVSSFILGKPKPVFENPWFWSDQFNIKFQSVGIYKPNSITIHRQGKREGSHSWWSFINNELKCVEAVNDVQAFTIAKMIFERNIFISQEQIKNKALNLKELIQ